jgi:hypothetical protein
MRFLAQNTNDATGSFDIELAGHGRIAHVDPWGADNPAEFRKLLCASPFLRETLQRIADETAPTQARDMAREALASLA